MSKTPEPLPLWQSIDYVATEVSTLASSPLLDVLQSIDHDLTGNPDHHAAAIAASSRLAEALAAAVDATRELGELIDHEVVPDRLLHDPTLKRLTPAQLANPRRPHRST